MPAESPVLDDLRADIGRIPTGPPPEVGGGDDRPPQPEPERKPVIENAKLGMLMFLGAETMFFGGLIAAFLVMRLGAPAWPPPAQPRLPVAVTGLNTLVLLASSFTLARALRAIRRGDQAGLCRGLAWTAALGAIFLGVQGYEWGRLVTFGLTLSSGLYGATFYTLIGTHGFHVLAALVTLSVVWLLAKRGQFTARNYLGASVSGMFWHYVVALWPILYTLVYLA
ncbi:MAG: heme-copper oxidase subunit III [Candidatus Methylomirabilia bacterium]